jgi:hypothetical protein
VSSSSFFYDCDGPNGGVQGHTVAPSPKRQHLYKLNHTITYPRTALQICRESMASRIFPLSQPQPLLAVRSRQSRSTLHLTLPANIIQFLTSRVIKAATGPRPSHLQAPIIPSTSPSNPLLHTLPHLSMCPRLLVDLHDPSQLLVSQAPSDSPSLSHPSIHGESLRSTRPSLRLESTVSVTPSTASGASMSEVVSIFLQKLYQGAYLPTAQSFTSLDRHHPHQ